LEDLVIPTPAEQARTALARARLGTLTTFGRRSLAPRMTTVSVTADGPAVVVRLRPGSLAVADLLARPLATVQIGPAGHEPVVLQGGASRLPGRDADGRLSFRLEPGAVRVGARSCAVPLPEFLSASPDPLHEDAPALLTHLRDGHRADLAACLRARGHLTVQWVEPWSLDRHGLVLLALTAHGVSRVRLDFPRPVAVLDDLGPGLSTLFRCRCTST
jgi:hypothetical protein